MPEVRSARVDRSTTASSGASVPRLQLADLLFTPIQSLLALGEFLLHKIQATAP